MERTFYFDIRKLAKLVRAKRGRKGLRETSTEIGNVSASTISRVERGQIPDIDTFLRLCGWLGCHPNTFIINTSYTPVNPLKKIEDTLRADTKLNTAIVEALITLIKAIYPAQ